MIRRLRLKRSRTKSHHSQPYKNVYASIKDCD